MIAFEVREAMIVCTSGKSPGVGGLPYKLYVFMPDLFGDLLAFTLFTSTDNRMGEFPVMWVEERWRC